MFLRSRPLTLRGLVVLLIAVGLYAVVDGFSLAVLEEDRGNYGRVISGVVIERLSSTGEEGTRKAGGRGIRGGSVVRMSGFDPYSTAVRVLATGSASAYIADYQYPCSAGSGRCAGRDFVDYRLWSRLRAGGPVNVRQSIGEKSTARLDDNPQWRIAITTAAFGGALLIAAAFLSGRLRLRPAAMYIKAPAVVTAVDEIRYGDEKRWRVTFRYFDSNSEPQVSIDEANDPSWRVGESCIAVYRPHAPDVATLQPLPGHGSRSNAA